MSGSPVLRFWDKLLLCRLCIPDTNFIFQVFAINTVLSFSYYSNYAFFCKKFKYSVIYDSNVSYHET